MPERPEPLPRNPVISGPEGFSFSKPAPLAPDDVPDDKLDHAAGNPNAEPITEAPVAPPTERVDPDTAVGGGAYSEGEDPIQKVLAPQAPAPATPKVVVRPGPAPGDRIAW